VDGEFGVGSEGESHGVEQLSEMKEEFRRRRIGRGVRKSGDSGEDEGDFKRNGQR